MKNNSVAILVISFCLLIASSANASSVDAPCSDYIKTLGIPKNPKTVIDFEYISVAIGEIKDIAPNCIPNSSNRSYLKFESLFSEKVIDNLIKTYTSYQVIQMALLDLKTTLSAISSGYVTDRGQFAIERAKLYLLQFYVMLKSLELYDQNSSARNTSYEQLTAIKNVVFNDLEIFEAYIKYHWCPVKIAVNPHSSLK